MASNESRRQLDCFPQVGKDFSPRWEVLPASGGGTILSLDGSVLDKAITHYPS